jgi:hypothetical protein
MTIQATDNFNFPYGDEVYRNWGGVWNGIAIDVDKLLKEARSPICDRDGRIQFNRTSGEVVLNRYNPS